jgi:iron complex transport system substrate-binding protein
MRIISLLPSATEIVCALGLDEELVGVSHRCDFPPEVASIQAVTRPGLNGGPTPVRGRSQLVPEDELGPVELDEELFVAAQPELVLVGPGPLAHRAESAATLMEPSPRIVTLNPSSVEGILHSISAVGSMTEAEDAAIDLIEELREAVGSIEQRVVVRHDQGLRAQRTVVLQGLSPMLSSGSWLPELVRRSGGWDLLGREGEAAAPTTWEAIADVDPDMLLFAPAGLTLLQAQALWRTMERPESWQDI